jgi:phospholipid/cholesterol/gamma-HCH transport system ATP-binding protein
VRENLHLLPKDAQAAILDSFKANGAQSDPRARHRDEDPDTASIPTQRGY